jgi:CelD/BcsL family acetyltransferase involved in cellulose biosynthesis
MRLEWITSPGEMDEIRPRWNALWNRSTYATPFQTPEWLISWTRHLFHGGEIRVAACIDGEDLVALAPFFIYGTDERRLAFLGSGISDYGDMLAEPGCERECASLILDTVAGMTADGIVCELAEIPENSQLLNGRDKQQCSVCPAIALPSKVEEIDDLLDADLRVDVRRARKRIESRIRFGQAGQETLGEYLEALFRLHAARWALVNEPGVLAAPEIQDFHRSAALEFLGRRMLRLHVLFVDDRIAALVYGFTAGRRFFAYLSAFDPALAKLSCGGVLIRHAIECAIQEGLVEFDFLRHPEPYKYKWGARDRINFALKM